jgi:hypothetical protein
MAGSRPTELACPRGVHERGEANDVRLATTRGEPRTRPRRATQGGDQHQPGQHAQLGPAGLQRGRGPGGR